MINYRKQVEYIKNNPEVLFKMVEKHQNKVKKKNYADKIKYYSFKHKENNPNFDFSLGELLVDSYAGLAFDNLYIQNKADRNVEDIVKKEFNNIDFINAVKDNALKQSCILGTSFLMLCLKKKNDGEIGDLKILNLSPANTYIRYDEFKEGQWAFRYYMSTNIYGYVDEDSKMIVEFIDDKFVTVYEKNLDNISCIETYLHGFDKLPIAEFSINEYRSDILTKAIVCTKKATEILNNADFSLKKALKEYMIAHNIKPAEGVSIEDIIKSILADRVGVLNDTVSQDGTQKLESGIEIVGGNNVTNFSEWLEFCKYIVQLIFMSSNIPNFSSDDFTNPQSGAALKMQLIPANAKVSSTKSFFRKSIKYLLDVLQPYFKVKYNITYNLSDFDIEIKSFEYSDLSEIASSVSTLKSTELFTNETLVKIANIVEDAAKEVEAKEEQDYQETSDYINRTNYEKD